MDWSHKMFIRHNHPIYERKIIVAGVPDDYEHNQRELLEIISSWSAENGL
jgi:predicted protein tyrosine phosphatase